MVAAIEPLVLDFLEWLAVRPRTYREVMDAWRTSCPRFTVWEDCVDAGYVAVIRPAGEENMVALTQRGREHLEASGRIPALSVPTRNAP